MITFPIHDGFCTTCHARRVRLGGRARLSFLAKQDTLSRVAETEGKGDAPRQPHSCNYRGDVGAFAIWVSEH